jgi:ACR3 family arsenite efflux pump ArsB
MATNAIFKFLGKLQKNLAVSIPVFMLLGVLTGWFFNAAPLKNFILPLTFFMVYPMMVTLDLKSLLKKTNTKLQVTTQLVNFILMPLIGFLMATAFFKGQTYIVLGLLLTSLLPTSGMTISWTGMAKGNVQEAVKMTVIGLILGSILAPFYLVFFLGTAIEIPVVDIARQILIVVFLPMVAGYATQRYLIRREGQEKFQKVYKARFPLISTLGVLAIVFIAVALRAKILVSNPGLVLQLLVPLILLYTLNFAISTTIGRLMFKREDAVAMIYGTVMRNLSISLAIAMTAFGSQGGEAVLVISLAFVIQAQAAAWYVKLFNRLFPIGEPFSANAASRQVTPEK